METSRATAEFECVREECRGPSVVKSDFLCLCSVTFFGPFVCALWLKFSLSLHDGVACVIDRIGFVFRTVVSNTLDHRFWVVAAGEGALGKSPVVFGLAYIVPGRGLAFGAVVVVVARRVLRIDL